MQASPASPAPRVVDRFFEYSMLGMLGSGYLAVVGTQALDWPSALLALTALCARALMTAGVVHIHLRARAVTAIAICYFGFFPVDYYYISQSFLAAIVHTIVFLGSLKLLTASTPRDYGYLKLLATLQLVAAAMLSVNLAFLAYLAVFVMFGIAALTSGEVRRAAREAGAPVSQACLRSFPRRLSMLSVLLLCGVFVMTAGLFLILPRTARAALGRFIPQRQHLSGFSDSVTLGEIGEIQQNNTPLLHARSYQGEGFLPVKWRGSALAEFDGKRWFNPPGAERLVPVDNGNVAIRTAVTGTRAGRNLIYQVHLEQVVADTLFVAGNPETISIDVPFLRLSRGGTFHVAPRFGARGLNYGVYAFQPDEWAEVRFTTAPLSEALRAELVSLPNLDPRIPRLARDFSAGAETEVQKARGIENHLRNDYSYTLQLLSKPVDDPLAYFLFERKKGHCEYFASAMAVMLRSIGIPSRVVTGFQSGVYNPMTGWQVVRASDAHSWVEAWLEGRGWTTFDPTPSDPSQGAPGFLSKLALLSDTAEQFWQDWVMSYDFDRQLALYSRVQESRRSMRLPRFDEITAGFARALQNGGKYAIGACVVVVFGALVILYWPDIARWWRLRDYTKRVKRGETRPSDATLLYQRMLFTLEKRGIQKPAWLTPMEFSRVIIPPKATPDIAPLVADATDAYNELRFGGRADAAPRMVRVLEAMEKL